METRRYTFVSAIHDQGRIERLDHAVDALGQPLRGDHDDRREGLRPGARQAGARAHHRAGRKGRLIWAIGTYSDGEPMPHERTWPRPTMQHVSLTRRVPPDGCLPTVELIR